MTISDDAMILNALDGKWSTVAEIRARIGHSASVETARALVRMAESGKIDEASEATNVTKRNGAPLKIRRYRRSCA
jgi:hypothetical protein